MFGVFSILNAINPERLAAQPYQGNSDVYVLLNSTADEQSTYNLMKSTPFTEEQKQKLYNISHYLYKLQVRYLCFLQIRLRLISLPFYHNLYLWYMADNLQLEAAYSVPDNRANVY